MGKKKSNEVSSAAAAEQMGAPERLVQAIEAGEVFAPRAMGQRSLMTPGEPWTARSAHGRSLREHVPCATHEGWVPAADRPDPLALVEATNQGRRKDLVPLRMGRMAATPFAFLRGAAAVMAWDLSRGPATGLNVVIDGDAHFNNFGLFGTAERHVVLDLNDFDEATIGPWEWDLKRLTASVNVAGRENGLSRKERRLAVERCVTGYRTALDRLQSLPVLDLWYENTAADRIRESFAGLDKKSEAVVAKAVAKARATDNAALLRKSAERGTDGRWRFKEEAPILTRVPDDIRDQIAEALAGYLETLPAERQYMLRRYQVVDMAHRVVGVGSVGTRAYLLLLMGNGDDDPLFLQVKEAVPAVHAPYLPPLPPAYAHDGKRVIHGQRLLQAAGDPLLGWTDVDGRPFYVRQMKNLKASVATDWLSGSPFNFFTEAYGALLARAHARVGDAAVIGGYCGTDDVLDRALADWAEAYGDQTERDHAALVEAIRDGRIEARDG